ncbi:MAG: hypothetical protein LBK94_11415, partial [Prevotellaceae bacterium]|nr:hypothetical protein [Prevotellaceae bacterium]
MSEKILDSLGVGEIQKEIKTLTDELQKVHDGLTGFGQKVADSLKDAIAALKELKATTNFTEFREAAKKATKETQEFTAAQKALADQTKTLETLKARLAALENQEAVAIQKNRLQIAEKTKQQKAEAQAIIAVEHAMNNYSDILGKSTKSIKDLETQNRQLRRVVETLNYSTQADEIEKLNKVIDGNTSIIKLNKDSYVQQKMNIGDYKTALAGVTAQIQLTTDKMKKLEAKGVNTDKNKAYKELQQRLVELNKEQAEYEKKVQKLIETEGEQVFKLKQVKAEMQALALKGKDSWSEDEAKRYGELREQAEKLQRAINSVNTQVNELAVNNIAMRAMADAFSIVTAGVQLYKEEMNALGISTESYQEVLVQLQRAQATINSLETLSAKLKANSTIQVYLQTVAEKGNTAQKWLATTAQWALNKAQAAMPYLAAGLIMLNVGKWLFSLATRTKELTEAQKALNEAEKEAVKIYADQSAKINILYKQISGANLTVKQQERVVKDLNEAVKGTGKHFDNWRQAEQFLLKDREKFIASIKEQALAQVLLNKITETYTKILEIQLDSSKSNDDKTKEIKNLQIQLTALANEFGDKSLFSNINKNFEDTIKAMTDATISESGKIENTLKERQSNINAFYDNAIQEQREILKNTSQDSYYDTWNRAYNKIIELQNQKHADLKSAEEIYNEDMTKLNKRAVEEQIEIAHTIEDLQIETMSGVSAGILGVSAVITSALSASLREHNKTLRQMETQRRREIEKVKGDAEQQATQVALINEKYRQKELQAQKDFAARQREIARGVQETNINNRLAVAQKGSQQEYELRIELLGQQRQAELDEAEKTGADKQAIIDKYAKAEKDAFEERMAGRIQAEMKEAEARLEVMNEMQGEEEKALLERYKNGEMTTEQYEQTLTGIKQKYSDMATQDAIDNLEKILQAEGLSDEQRADLVKQLTDKQKELSDEQTAHTISNIEKENAKRKKSAELAKEYAQQAFETTMEFLTQISEAKIEAFDEELERIEAWKEAELARLDESVMSEETRAAEEKRIEDEAEAQRKKVEEEKRQEQAKQFRYQQLQSVAQT